MKFKTTELSEEENLIVWKPSFAIGIPVIDAEHKQLVELCNELYKAIMSNKNSERKDVVRIALKECADYVRTHFANEEKLMQVCGYKDFEAHKRTHAEFAHRAHGHALRRRFESVLGQKIKWKMTTHCKKFCAHLKNFTR